MSTGVGGWAMVVNVLILRIGAQLWTVLEDEWILESWCASHYVHAYNGAVRTYQNWVMKQVQKGIYVFNFSVDGSYMQIRKLLLIVCG